MKLKNKNESPILSKNMKYKHGVIKKLPNSTNKKIIKKSI